MARFSVFKPFRVSFDFLRSSFDELKKVTWPTREQAIQYTTVVVLSVLIVTGLMAALDYGLSQLLNKVIEWSQK